MTQTPLARSGCAVWRLHRIGPANRVRSRGSFLRSKRGSRLRAD